MRYFIASVIAGALTLALVMGVKRSVAYRPAVAGCGTHDGLVVAADVDVSPGFQRRALIQAWNSALSTWNSGKSRDQRATLVEVSRSTDEVRSELSAALGSGSCAYDVVTADVAWIPEYVQRGLLAEVKSSWMANPQDFIERTAATGRWRGHQYAVPWFTDAGLLYEHGGQSTPQTWQDLLNRGYVSQLANYEGLTVNALEVIWNTQRQQVLSGPVDKVDEQTARVILGGLLPLAKAPVSQSRAYEEDGSLNAFIGGGVPMRNWPYAFRVLTADPRVRSDFQVHTLPGQGFSVLGGWDLAVSANSRHKAAAGALINFLTDTKNQRQMFSCGGFTPTRFSAFENPQPCGDTNRFQPDELPSAARFEEFSNTLKAALFNALPRPVTPYYAQFSETFRNCVVPVLDSHGTRLPTAGTLANALTAALHGRSGGC